MILKVTKNKAWHSLQTVYFLKYILRVKVWICFLNETSILVFAELAILHSIYIKTSLEKNARKMTW